MRRCSASEDASLLDLNSFETHPNSIFVLVTQGQSSDTVASFRFDVAICFYRHLKRTQRSFITTKYYAERRPSMAKMLEAHREYGPRLRLNATAQLEEVAEWLAMRTGVNKNEILMVTQEFKEAILYFNRRGTPVKLPGIGTFAPSIDRGGTIKINLRTDARLRKQINAPSAYVGPVINASHIGIDDQVYKSLWDETHPGDPLQI
jgi:hypothetical protein